MTFLFNLDHLVTVADHRSEEWSYAEHKYDGIRLIVERGTRGELRAVTKSGKTDFIDAVKVHYTDQLDMLPEGTALDCEAWVPGEPACDVKTRLIARNHFTLTPFAIPHYRGQDFRDSDIEQVRALLKRWGWVPATVTSDIRFEALPSHCEGYVLKAAHGGPWYRFKPFKTAYCVVTGYSISKSDTHFGGLKALKVSLEGREIASVGSGFDALWRMEVDPETLVGRVCEIKFDRVDKQRLRFPTFRRWRDDVDPEECKLEQIE